METSNSLLHRLAGPSTGKAGLQKDQTSINEIIAKASEGSKFYENEKRKDEELTKKIEATLKQRDQLLKVADIGKLEVVANRLIAALEESRDLTQIIVHVDLDAFFAAVEELDDHSLVGKAFGVSQGVLSTASYEARKYGVRSGMPVYIARKLCPHLITVRGRHNRYSELSKQIMNILRQYDPSLFTAGTDEAYLNITQYCLTHGIEAQDCVSKLRAEIQEQTRLTASAGIAPNKMLAKICSDKNKPNGQFLLPFEQKAVVAFMKDLPIRKIPGIGRVTERQFDAIGIKTCGDIYTHRATLMMMDKQFHAQEMFKIYLGVGSTTVQPWAREERKSVGYERTFRALSDPDQIVAKLDECAKELEEDLVRLGFAGHTITLKLKLDTFELRSRAKTVPNKAINKYEDIITIGKELLEHELPLKLRLIGLRATNLKDLNAPERGIKRFFEAAEDAQNEHRPNKRRKGELGHPDAEYIRVSSDDDTQEINPPPAHRDRASSASPQKSQKLVDPHLLNKKRALSLEPPSSQETPSLQNKPSTSSIKREKQSNLLRLNDTNPTNQRKSLPNQDSGEVVLIESAQRLGLENTEVVEECHMCPICSKTIKTDNIGLNAHIDFCLSRGAILEASASVRKGGTVDTERGKPSTSTTSISRKATTKDDIRKMWKR